MIYEKPRAELFAQDAPDSEIKPFTAWLRGLGIAFDETGGLPEMESFNGLLQALNGYIKYLEQNGFAEWSSDLEYPVGAGVRVGAAWYRAKIRNTNKPPATSQNDWSLFLNAGDLSFSDPIQLVNGVISIKNASQTQKGAVQFASNQEISERLNISKSINPAGASTIAQSTDLGVGQLYQNLTSSRSAYVNYVNNTPKPIFLSIVVRDSGNTAGINLYVAGFLAVNIPDISGSSSGYHQVTAIIPSGNSYRLDTQNPVHEWKEVR